MNKTQEQLVLKLNRLVNGGAIEEEYKFVALQGTHGVHLGKQYFRSDEPILLDDGTHAELLNNYSMDTRALLEIIDHLKNERDQYKEDYNNFINEAWQIAREDTMGEWDYPPQVLRHLKERIAELKGEKQPLKLPRNS